MDKIKKRNGTYATFDPAKIQTAIMKANVRVAEEPMTEEDLSFLTQRVVKKLEKENEIPDVEHIQDIVERTLSKAGYSRTAKAYILYRAEHAKMREMRDTLPEIFSNLTFKAASEVDMKRENANINTDTAMGTMLKFGTESAKDYFDKFILPPHIAQADHDGDIHIHDKDFYTITETCCQIDLLKLFKDGFSTGHGYLREPNSIRSYAALACIAIQANQNEMHGGQAVPNFDYAMADGVRKTYRKSFLKHLAETLENKGIWPIGTGYQELKKIDLTVPTLGQADEQKWPNVFDNKIHEALDTYGILVDEDYRHIARRAYMDTVDETHQAMEAVIHNLNTLHARAGAQVPFSSINYGTDTSPEGQLAIREILNATEDGLGNGETPIFPVQIFKVKEGVNYNPGDPNYSLLKQAMRVSAKRLFPNFSFMDAPFNKQYLGKHPDKPWYDEVGYMGCVLCTETVTWQNKDVVKTSKIGEVWDLLVANYHPVLHYGVSSYIDLENSDISIYDSTVQNFVKVKKWIKNPVHKPWLKVTAENGKALVVTEDHPLMADTDTKTKGRIHAKDLKPGDRLYYIEDKSSIRPVSITNIETVQPEALNNGHICYDVETESDRFDVSSFISHNCRTRVMANVYDPENEITPGRGNLSFTSINLPRVAIQSRNMVNEKGEFNSPTNMEKFYRILDERIDLCIEQLLHRFKIQCSKHVYNYPFLMGEGVWINSEKLKPNDTVGELLKHGTLSVGFIGLAETLVALTGKHHGESEESWKLGYEIIKYMRERMDQACKKYKLNLSLLATPGEGLCIAGDTSVQTIDGCKPIKDIKTGDPVVTLNESTGRFEIDTVVAAGQTGIRDDIYEVEFTNGQKIVCTSNHPFAKRSMIRCDATGKILHGETIEWTQAQYLKEGDRIRSGYRTKSDGGYLRYKHGPKGCDYLHKMAYEYFTGQKVPNGMVVHHKDENKQHNSDLTNLELMTSKAHKIYHLKDTIGRYTYTIENQLGEKNSFFGKRHSEETKKQICKTKGFNYVSAEQLAKEYTETTMTTAELAAKHDLHISTVCHKLRSQGVKIDHSRRHYPTKKNDPLTLQLVDEYYQGYSAKELAEKHELSYSLVYSRLKSVGVQFQRNHTVKTVRKLNISIPVYDITMSKNHNFLVGGEEGILVHNSGTFVRSDKKKYGIIPGVTDREYYTNSFHVPVYYNISAFDKIKKEAPFHELTNAGHISYVEVDGDIAKNLDAFEAIIRCMKESGIGYGSINHPVDRDPICGYVGIINEVCPRCGRRENEAVSLEKLEELKKKYRNMPDITEYIE